MQNKSPGVSGVLAGLTAFVFWGFLPLYWKLLREVPVMEILAHRVVWAAVFAALILGLQGQLRATLVEAVQGGAFRMFLLSSALIGSNWAIYIWSVNSNQVLESSFGYFINPLANVTLGYFFMDERLGRRQLLALGLAASGVLVMALSYGRLPWIALALAGSFALYGLVRKKAPAGAVRGLFLESTLLVPIALAYIFWLGTADHAQFLNINFETDALLICGGIVTGIPLLAFGAAVTRLSLSTIGFMQYLAPTCQFLLAVFVFEETLEPAKIAGFSLIWAGLAVYSTGSGTFKRPGLNKSSKSQHPRSGNDKTNLPG